MITSERSYSGIEKRFIGVQTLTSQVPSTRVLTEKAMKAYSLLIWVYLLCHTPAVPHFETQLRIPTIQTKIKNIPRTPNTLPHEITLLDPILTPWPRTRPRPLRRLLSRRVPLMLCLLPTRTRHHPSDRRLWSKRRP